MISPASNTYAMEKRKTFVKNIKREIENVKGASPKIHGNKEDREILVGRIWFTAFEALWLSVSCHFAEQQFSYTPAALQKSCLDCPFPLSGHHPKHQETPKCRYISDFLIVDFSFIGKSSLSG